MEASAICRRQWRRLSWLALATLMACGLCGVQSALGQPNSAPLGVVTVERDDPELNAAIGEARRTLPRFHGLMAKFPKGRPFVKVVIRHGGGEEHLWMEVFAIDGDQYVGQIVNEGESAPFKPGDGYRAAREDVSDWMLRLPPFDKGDIHGGYTLRVLMRRYPGSVPSDYGKRLQPLK